MDIRYDTENFNLKLVNVNYGPDEKASDKDDAYELGDLESLLTWHCEEEVTQEEITRNDRVQKWQGNRNPFIDYPELVEEIYGKKCDSDIINILIVSALVNPDGHDGRDDNMETVTIENLGITSVNLKGWTIAGNNGNTSDLDDMELAPGERYVIEGLGRSGSAQLTNRIGSTITLYDDAQNIIDKVTYDRFPSGEEIDNDDFSRGL